jgi:ubiquitin-conjugating enzyme E2 G1
MSGIIRLHSELKEINNNPNYFYSIEPNSKNIYEWNALLIGPPDTIFEGGLFKSKLVFPKNYPNEPPEFKFITNIPHPNIYPDGKICISILHKGTDEFGYEHITERWNPTHSVDTILISIISVLSNPNFESVANVDASNLWKNNYEEYKKIIYQIVSNTQ